MTERLKSWFSGASSSAQETNGKGMDTSTTDKSTSSSNTGANMASEEDMEKKAEELLKKQHTQKGTSNKGNGDSK